MLVDITVFIQILNFIIAYLMFTHIFLRPAYRVVIEQRVGYDQLERETQDIESTNNAYKLQLHAELIRAQQAIKQTLPALSSDCQLPIVDYSVQQCDHSDAVLDPEELSTLLVDQVIHDAVQ